MTLGELKKATEYWLTEGQGRKSRYLPVINELIDRFGPNVEVSEQTMKLIRKRLKQQTQS